MRKLTKNQYKALYDAKISGKTGSIWMPKTMASLEKQGLVAVAGKEFGLPAYILTEAGQKAYDTGSYQHT